MKILSGRASEFDSLEVCGAESQDEFGSETVCLFDGTVTVHAWRGIARWECPACGAEHERGEEDD